MTEEDFLARWSRRKREAEDEKPAPQKVALPEQADPKRVPAKEPEFDITTLPPIESITSVTDVTAFLRAGVPPDLTRAALRRVWTADPAIRDFIGLAENAWDFTDPNAMPGFGPLEDTESVRRMIAQVVDSIGQAPRDAALENAPQPVEVVENSSDSKQIKPAAMVAEEAGPDGLPPEEEQQIAAQALGDQVLLQSTMEDDAVQHEHTEAQEKPKQLPRRGHGGALPQ